MARFQATRPSARALSWTREKALASMHAARARK
eukprot:CAMPEP_0175762064 /NCGR_PEP_ID=MMETSP0097-20121207/66996_1 /TAXON_ID=311494 /ORGANISM="Alexandrium monilatum, Strain CCMP3105" /LENGTH=32 /DNA_ID= /DNA_START= /DNA_END= /DNA_ORIENTATION=